MGEPIELCNRETPLTAPPKFFIWNEDVEQISESELDLKIRNDTSKSDVTLGANAISLPNLRTACETNLNIPASPDSRRVGTPLGTIPDSVSAVFRPGTPYLPMTKAQKMTLLRRNLSIMLSCSYAFFLVMLGGVIYISDQETNENISQSFSCTIIAIGMAWMIFLHIDLNRYKKSIEKNVHKAAQTQDTDDRLSTITEAVLNETLTSPTQDAPYRFLTGRHSGSFYLKVGMAAFCFGHLIHEGLQLGQHIMSIINHEDEKRQCTQPSTIILHSLRPIYSFYQLFITFKYSNIIINRFRELARFGLMHLIATCICFWFSTIVQEAVEDYHEKTKINSTVHDRENFYIGNFRFVVEQNDSFIDSHYCKGDSVLSIRSLRAIPYLYPFTIEYNLLLAGIWFVVWQNIGNVHSNALPHHFRRKITQHSGANEVEYQSNLTINADCHAANKGLFAGLCLLLIIIITVIVFFVAISTEGYSDMAVMLHTVQECTVTVIALIGVLIAYHQISQLDFNLNPITFLDDVLLFIPLPFYFVNGILSLMAAWKMSNYPRIVLYVVLTCQVVIQTPFIIDGLRRCSNSNHLRFKKPGREIITFLIISNLTIWIVNTFELKSVDHYYAQSKYYGHLVWMFIGHTTLPLMLFYRFHSSVCLADMWKSAYEKGE